MTEADNYFPTAIHENVGVDETVCLPTPCQSHCIKVMSEHRSCTDVSQRMCCAINVHMSHEFKINLPVQKHHCFSGF